MTNEFKNNSIDFLLDLLKSLKYIELIVKDFNNYLNKMGDNIPDLKELKTDIDLKNLFQQIEETTKRIDKIML